MYVLERECCGFESYTQSSFFFEKRESCPGCTLYVCVFACLSCLYIHKHVCKLWFELFMYTCTCIYIVHVILGSLIANSIMYCTCMRELVCCALLVEGLHNALC